VPEDQNKRQEKRLLTNRAERRALLRKANFRCEICGCALEKDWHADHVIPFSVSKKTDFLEMQALCRQCNLRKGASMSGSNGKNGAKKNRKHQAEMEAFLAQEDTRVQITRLSQQGLTDDEKLRILAIIVPGGGKTFLAVILARALCHEFNVLILTPRLSLVKQAYHDFRENQITLIPFDKGWIDELSPETDVMNRLPGTEFENGKASGMVMSFSMATLRAEELALRMSALTKKNEKPWCVVIDEGHHLYKAANKKGAAGDGNISAKKINQYILDPWFTRIILRMTGTPDHQDNLMDGVKYEEVTGKGGKKIHEPDYKESADKYINYTRRNALAESAIVPIQFHTVDGKVQYIDKGKRKTSSVSDNASKRKVRKILWAALATEYAYNLAEDCLNHFRGYVKVPAFKMAKGIAVLSSQREATALIKWAGEKYPDIRFFLAISDTGDAHTKIDEFKACKEPAFLVTVAIAYEGLNVPNISHILALTYYRSKGWIHQMLARAWRKTEWKDLCHAWVPKDEMMTRIIEKLSKEQMDYFESSPGVVCGPGGGGGVGEKIVPIGSRMTTLETRYLDSDHWRQGADSEKNKMNDQEAKDLEEIRLKNPEWASVIEASLFAKDQNRLASEEVAVSPVDEVEDVSDDPAKLREAYKKVIKNEVNKFVYDNYIPHLYPGKTKDDPEVKPYVSDLFMRVNEFVNKGILRCRKRDSADFEKLKEAASLVCDGKFISMLCGRYIKNV